MAPVSMMFNTYTMSGNALHPGLILMRTSSIPTPSALHLDRPRIGAARVQAAVLKDDEADLTTAFFPSAPAARSRDVDVFGVPAAA